MRVNRNVELLSWIKHSTTQCLIIFFVCQLLRAHKMKYFQILCAMRQFFFSLEKKISNTHIFFNEVINDNTQQLENDWLPVLVENYQSNDIGTAVFKCFPCLCWRSIITLLRQKLINFILECLFWLKFRYDTRWGPYQGVPILYTPSH